MRRNSYIRGLTESQTF